MNTSDHEEREAMSELSRLFKDIPSEVSRQWFVPETSSSKNDQPKQKSVWAEAGEKVNDISPCPSLDDQESLIGAWAALLSATRTKSEHSVEEFLAAALESLAKVKDSNLRDRVFAEWIELVPSLADRLKSAKESIGLTGSGNENEPTDEDKIVLPPAKPRWHKWLTEPLALAVLVAVILVGIIGTKQLMKPGNDRKEPSVAMGDHDELHEDFPFVEPPPLTAGPRETRVFTSDEYSLDVIKDTLAARSNDGQSVLFLIDKELVKKIAWTNNGEVVFAESFQTSARAREVESMEVFLLVSSKEPCNALSVFRDQESSERIQEFLRSEMTRQTPGQFAKELLDKQYDPQTMKCVLWRAKHELTLRPPDPRKPEPSSK